MGIYRIPADETALMFEAYNRIKEDATVSDGAVVNQVTHATLYKRLGSDVVIPTSLLNQRGSW